MKLPHAITGAARLSPITTTKGSSREVHLFTACGIWVTSERCEEDLRATCETCKSRLVVIASSRMTR